MGLLTHATIEDIGMAKMEVEALLEAADEILMDMDINLNDIIGVRVELAKLIFEVLK